MFNDIGCDPITPIPMSPISSPSLATNKEAAIQALMHQYGESVYHLVCMTVKNHALVEDITQEVFIKAYRNVDSFRGEGKIKNWLYKIAMNETNKYFRSWSFRNIWTTLDKQLHILIDKQARNDVESEILERVTKETTYQLIMSLPNQYSQIIILHYYEDLFILEVSQILSVSTDVVRTRLQDFVRTAKDINKTVYPFHSMKLQATILNKIQGQSSKKRWKKWMWLIPSTACLAFILLINSPYSTILDMENHSAMSEKSFRYMDEGFLYARNNGYAVLPTITSKLDVTTIEIKDAMVDQQRMIYTVFLSGDFIDKIAQETDKAKKSSLLYENFRMNLKKNFIVRGERASGLTLIDQKNYVVIEGYYQFNLERMNKKMSEPNPTLPLQIKWEENGKKQSTSLNLPLPKELATPKIILPTHLAKAELDKQDIVKDISFKQMVMSPTIMRVELAPDMKKEYKLRSLLNGRLVDESGRIFKGGSTAPGNPNLSYPRESVPIAFMQFIPSLYFEKLPTKLTLLFDGIIVSQLLAFGFILYGLSPSHSDYCFTSGNSLYKWNNISVLALTSSE